MRLLIVEDDPDGRELLAELFKSHAWHVTAVPTTCAALTELRRGGFDVVVSDEDLEGQSGSSMLCQASAEGLLRSVGALMYTAESARLEVPAGVRVLRKPLGITILLDAVRALAGKSPRATSPGAAERPSKPGQLAVYATESPSSQRALRELERGLEAPRSSRHERCAADLDRRVRPRATDEGDARGSLLEVAPPSWQAR